VHLRKKNNFLKFFLEIQDGGEKEGINGKFEIRFT